MYFAFSNKAVNENIVSVTKYVQEDALNITTDILSRKAEHILSGYSEYDWSFLEMATTFADVAVDIKNKIKTLESLSSEFLLLDLHSTLPRLLLEYKNLLTKLEDLASGIEVTAVDSTAHKKTIMVKYPYRESIRLCVAFADANDKLTRTINSLQNFGACKPYFKKAVKKNQKDNKDIFAVQMDLKDQEQTFFRILELQDYITAFEMVLQSTQQDQLRNVLESAKAKNYTLDLSIKQELDLHLAILKKMTLPFLFHTPRNKDLLENDLLHRDVIVYPTMENIGLQFYKNTRQAPFYVLGLISDKTFADEFVLTASEFVYHDVNHTLDAIARTMVSVRERQVSYSEAYKLHNKFAGVVAGNIENLGDFTASEFGLDEIAYSSVLTKLIEYKVVVKCDSVYRVSYKFVPDEQDALVCLKTKLKNEVINIASDTIDTIVESIAHKHRLRRAINLIVFEIIHEDGWAYDPRNIIENLQKPNVYNSLPYVFAMEKFQKLNFYSKEGDTKLASDAVVLLFKEASDQVQQWAEIFTEKYLLGDYKIRQEFVPLRKGCPIDNGVLQDGVLRYQMKAG